LVVLVAGRDGNNGNCDCDAGGGLDGIAWAAVPVGLCTLPWLGTILRMELARERREKREGETCRENDRDSAGLSYCLKDARLWMEKMKLHSVE
jgi:hypothetical protein